VLPFLFEEWWQGIPVYSTVKVDGQNVNFALHKGRFYIASRNRLLYDEDLSIAKQELIPENRIRFRAVSVFHDMACRYLLPLKLEFYGLADHVLQCEQAGPCIQGNKMGLADNTLFIFNLFDIQEQRFRSWEAIDLFSFNAGIPTVPFIEETKFHWKTIDDLYKYSKGKYPNGHAREGVVIRATGDGKYLPLPEIGMVNSFSFKIINPDYLLQD
jgi:hypothetical protein